MYMVHLDIQYGVIKDVYGPLGYTIRSNQRLYMVHLDIQHGVIKDVYGPLGYTIRSNQRCIWSTWIYNTE